MRQALARTASKRRPASERSTGADIAEEREGGEKIVVRLAGSFWPTKLRNLRLHESGPGCFLSGTIPTAEAEDASGRIQHTALAVKRREAINCLVHDGHHTASRRRRIAHGKHFHIHQCEVVGAPQYLLPLPLHRFKGQAKVHAATVEAEFEVPFTPSPHLHKHAHTRIGYKAGSTNDAHRINQCNKAPSHSAPPCPPK